MNYHLPLKSREFTVRIFLKKIVNKLFLNVCKVSVNLTDKQILNAFYELSSAIKES